MKQSKKIIQQLKKTLTLEHCAVRAITAWCFVSFILAVCGSLSSGISLASLNFVGLIPMGLLATVLLVVFAAWYLALERLQALQTNHAEETALLLCSFLYALLCLASHPDLYLALGLTFLMIFSITYYLKGRTTALHWGTLTCRLVRIGAALFFVLFLGTALACKCLTFQAPNFDMGLFAQMFHYMKTAGTMQTTCERDQLLSHLCVHISPDFYLLLPFYALFSSAAALNASQALVLVLGLIPLVRLCRIHRLSNFETTMLTVIYCFYPVVSGSCFYDIHENVFLAPFLLWLLLAMEKERPAEIAVSALLVCMVKEDAPVYAAFIGLYFLLRDRHRSWKKGAGLFIGAVVYFILINWLLRTFGEGAIMSRFNNMIYGGDGNMLGVLRTVLTDPGYLLTQVFIGEKLAYLLEVLAPLCFLPLITRKWERFLLFGPFVLFNLMSDYTYFHSIFFQYTLGSGMLLLYLAVINLADLSVVRRNQAVLVAAAASVFLFLALISDKASYLTAYLDPTTQETCEVLQEGLDTIPQDASVTATTMLCQALSDHDTLYELYYTTQTTEYVALDLRYDTADYNVNTYLQDDRYETVYYAPFKIAVFRNKAYN